MKTVTPQVHLDGYSIPGKGLEVNIPTADDWPEIRPLKTELLPVKPITPDMLPPAFSGWLADIIERMDNAPFEYAAISAVVIASSLIGRKLLIQPKKHDDWSIVPNLWGCCVGRPSTKKSPVIKAVTAPLSYLEKEARNQYKEDMRAYEVQQKITNLTEKEALNKATKYIRKGDFKAAEALLMDDSGDPEKPVCKRYIVNDSTIEKLGVLLAENPRGLVLVRDELTGWIAGLNRDDRQQDRAFWLEAFNGDGDFRYDRISRESIFIPSNTVSLLGGIQPSKLLPLLLAQRDGSGDDGLVERFQLMVYPDIKSFIYKDRKPNVEKREKAYQVFSSLDGIGYCDLETDRPVLKFDNEAQELFSDWYCNLMTRVSGNDINQRLESHLGKYPSLMPSLSLIFHVAECGLKANITVDSVKLAIRWCEVLETHARRVYALADGSMAGAKILFERLQKLPAEFKMDDLRDKGWMGLQGRQEREEALKILEEHGYLVKVEERHSNKGRSSVTYKVNPFGLKNITEGTG